jgi:acyl carrier protein
MDHEDKIRRFIADELLEQSDDLTADTPLMETGVLNSISIVRLISYLEAEFDIEVAPRHIVRDNLGSVRAIARFVSERREGKRA